MPERAHKGSKTGEIVNARDCTINDKNNKFFCITEDCNAEMSLVSVANPDESYFRRLPSSPRHISVNCVRCSLTFDPTKYDESKFNSDSAFDWIFSPGTPTNRNGGNRVGHIGGGHNSLRTLGNIYRMCVSREKNDTYNGVLIDDIFADAENCSRYKDELIGRIIVECSFYKKAYKKSALLFNYPTDFTSPHRVLRVNFSVEQDCWDYYKKLKKSDHTEPIAIAGDWRKAAEGEEYQFECDFSSKRQIYIVK